MGVMPPRFDKPNENDVWVSLLMGGGLGIGFVKGDLRWNPAVIPRMLNLTVNQMLCDDTTNAKSMV